MNSSSSTNSNIASSLTGIGLFIVTVAVSQWIQIHHNNKSINHLQAEDEDDDEEEEEEEEEEQRKRRRRRKALLRKAFRQRQVSRRLSFQEFKDTDRETEEDEEDPFWNKEEVGNSTTINNDDDDDDDDDDDNRLRFRSSSTDHPTTTDTEWSIHHSATKRQHNILSKGGSDNNDKRRRGGGGRGATSSSSSSSQHQNRRQHQCSNELSSGTIKSSSTTVSFNNNDRCIFQNDFHPKYQNWRHFEPNNKHDIAAKQRRKQRQQLDKLQQQRQQQYQKLTQYEGETSAAVVAAVAAATTSSSSATTSTTTTRGTSEDQSSNITIEDPRLTTVQVPIHDDDNVGTDIGTNTDTNVRRSMSLHVDNGSDISVESFSTSSSSSLPSSSFDSGNEFVWTGGTKKKKKDLQTSTTTKTTSMLKDAPPPPIPPPTRPPRSRAVTYDHSRSSSNNNKNYNCNSHINNKNHQRTNSEGGIGRFQRFCQMLSISDNDNIGEDTITGNKNNNISNNDDRDDIDDDNTYDVDDDGNADETQHRALRTEYNAQIMPEKLVLIRHGQSAGNVDEAMYAITPDNAMPLTDLGWDQARKAGEILKEKMITSGESVHFIVSPYVRTVETFHGIVSAWCDPDGDEFACIDGHDRKVVAWYERLTELGLTWNEDSRIREQDFGNYQTPEVTKRAKEERHRFGAFYYRFNNGESGSDVFDRVSTFLDSLWRSFETNKSQNYVLITHGIVLRVLMARYFRYTISQLNMLANPKNCEMVVLGHSGDGRLDLEGCCDVEVEEDPETKESHVTGYKYRKFYLLFFYLFCLYFLI